MPQADSRRDSRLWVERLRLTDFRNYAALTLDLDARPVVLTGPNGAGKTNLLEAVSLLAPGQGLRASPYAQLARQGGSGGWAVAARVHGLRGRVDIGTGHIGDAGEGDRAGRSVRIDGVTARTTSALGEHVRVVWLTPSMDGLFTGPAAERRRFLDRMVHSLDSGQRALSARFERAMRQRNRLLETGGGDGALFAGIEAQMAAAGVAVAAARLEAVRRLNECIAARRRAAPDSPFPWAGLELKGLLESQLAAAAALDVEDAYAQALAASRGRDREARRTLEGPHRSDLAVTHGPRAQAAALCSTGEQKALLVGLVLAQAQLLATALQGRAPLLLLDEVAAHLDGDRRAALFAEIAALRVQAWMTGTDWKTFEILDDSAQFLAVDNGSVRR